VGSKSVPDDARATADRHRQICTAFGNEVSTLGDHWQAQSPCDEWDARSVLEHVIGLHDVLLLRPLAAKPQRPKDDPVGRWATTVGALDQVLSRVGLCDGVVEVPAFGNNQPTQIDAARIVPMLSLDVFIHTWDLGRAAGHEVVLNPDLCRMFLEGLPTDDTSLSRTGMYASPRRVSIGSDPQSRLLARLGRDPHWTP